MVAAYEAVVDLPRRAAGKWPLLAARAHVIFIGIPAASHLHTPTLRRRSVCSTTAPNRQTELRKVRRGRLPHRLRFTPFLRQFEHDGSRAWRWAVSNCRIEKCLRIWVIR